MSDDVARETLEKVTSTFLGRAPQRQRAKPNRCLGCGKVSRTIFCQATYAACRAAYHERTNR